MYPCYQTFFIFMSSIYFNLAKMFGPFFLSFFDGYKKKSIEFHLQIFTKFSEHERKKMLQGFSLESFKCAQMYGPGT